MHPLYLKLLKQTLIFEELEGSLLFIKKLGKDTNMATKSVFETLLPNMY